MGKLPAFQFYPGDWLKDPSIRACSLEEKGLSLEILLLMHESPQRGYLLIGDCSPTPQELARMVGTSEKKCDRLLRSVEKKQVFSRDEHGVLYSRRILRDEAKRQQDVVYGKRGGSELLKLFTLKGGGIQAVKGKDNQVVKGTDEGEAGSEHPPSSSPSVTSSTSTSPSSSLSDSRIKTFIDWWSEEYQKRFNQKYLVIGKDAATVKRLLGAFDEDTLRQYAAKFLDTDDEFVRKAGYTIGIFWSQINKLTSGGKHGGKFERHNEKDRAAKFRAIEKSVEM